ncbi:aspartyl/asparaginyl beta-hydroxylase-like dioxygenase [Mycobacteroides abscessus subsp. abscessus]|uniref:aspartyl/asparaginyl beta-hydroxylase domain-containing protein n=1 Tax=Mycobacteroides abscessus TaxID=36809 RepID=UPI0005E0C0C9|nr:aspartyl/asparaginyl beta-hydroxylase domain-containing protein [Mycobacteroides abscessus]CPV55717.1 aspartyl/asparaginyl beta-hydroxylase-like dioxygenase [Mycobacteroides abscessus]SHQ63830.1 aspartyl/asparaginyl beta-hydroxylase-like dioxygenase [Mycobacteroides abscessus subsp. abscessus]SHR33503.1 aspartyl/asparaginyl beta-hydroxylase-like dioxygenase [Mycobacteroides abscessus subsp. abscessus]SHZ30797.1 aspartyl/asparaginyl beta-hydroxylase-like dioxygenase [Mycobacteroides abscessus
MVYRDAIRHQSVAVRRQYNLLIGALYEEGDVESARQVAELAVAQGVWRDPMQRPPHYVAELEPRPVYDPDEFWFTAYLEDNYEKIRAELDAVTRTDEHGFMPVEELLLERGRWDQVVLYEGGVRFDEACARFPVTTSIVEGIPDATVAGPGVVTISWLYPGSHIVPHCGGSNARLRVHLGLRVPEGPRFRVGNEMLTWQEGKCLVFDDGFEHEVWHEGTEPRVVLLLDVSHPYVSPDVRDWMISGRSLFTERMRSYMAERGIERVDVNGDDEVILHPNLGIATLARRYLRELNTSAAELRDGTLVFPDQPRLYEKPSGER